MNSIGAPAKRRAIFSICAANYLARAAVLMDSVARHLPGHDRYLVLAADGVAPGDVAIYPAGTRLLTPADVAVPDLDLRRRLYNVTEFCTSIKPDMLGWLLDQGYDEVLYVDPDIVFFAPPDEIAAAFAAGADIVLTPHLVTASDHPQWALRAVSLSGQFNLGFIGLGAGAEARRALEWWRARIAMHCVEDAANGVFVDQKAVDFFASLFPGAHVIRHPGYNVAYWNLHERRLQQVGAGIAPPDRNWPSSISRASRCSATASAGMSRPTRRPRARSRRSCAPMAGRSSPRANSIASRCPMPTIASPTAPARANWSEGRCGARSRRWIPASAPATCCGRAS